MSVRNYYLSHTYSKNTTFIKALYDPKLYSQRCEHMNHNNLIIRRETVYHTVAEKCEKKKKTLALVNLDLLLHLFGSLHQFCVVLVEQVHL